MPDRLGGQLRCYGRVGWFLASDTLSLEIDYALCRPQMYFSKQKIAAVQDYSHPVVARQLRTSFRGLATVADIFTQMDSIGVGSMPIIVLTGFFTGACWRCSQRRR